MLKFYCMQALVGTTGMHAAAAGQACGVVI